MNISELARYVTPYAGACPDPLILMALRQAIREFAEYTRDYRTSVDVAMLEDTSTYDLAPSMPAGTEYDRIESVLDGDKLPIRPFAEHDFDLAAPDWRTHKGPRVERYTMVSPYGVMRVYPTPDSAGQSLSVTVSLRPSFDAQTVEDGFAKRHAEFIGYGAAGILLKMPGKPWTNPEAGVHYYQLFSERMSKTRVRRLHDHTTAAARIPLRGLEDY